MARNLETKTDPQPVYEPGTGGYTNYVGGGYHQPDPGDNTEPVYAPVIDMEARRQLRDLQVEVSTIPIKPVPTPFGPSGATHRVGLVPDPGASAGITRFLREDASWAVMGSAPSTIASLTMNSSGTGAASGTAFNGASGVTLSYNTIGAAPTVSPTFTGTVTTAALTATTGTFSGILSGSETRLGGLSYTRTAVQDGSGGWCGGYNLTFSGGIKNDSTGALAGFHCSTTGFKVYTNASAAAGTPAVLRLTVGLTGDATFASSVSMGALTADTNTIVVDSTNHRLGVGTAGPATKLEVTFTGNTGIRLSNTGNGVGDYSVLDFYQNNAQIALLYTHLNNFTISTTGTLTISSTSASFGSSAVSMGALTASTGNFTGSNPTVSLTGAIPAVLFQSTQTGTQAWKWAGCYNDLNSISLVDVTSGNAPRIYIDNSGNMGIGTTTPAGYRLNVNGSVYMGALTATSVNGITALSSTTPTANGTAAVGTSTTVARADHVHPSSNSLLNYSTTEQNTGQTWIGGGAIYQKTVDLGAMPNATSKNVSHGISGLSMVIKIEGAIGQSGNNFTSLPRLTEWNVTQACSVNVTTTQIQLGTQADLSTYTGYITLFYTK